MKNIYITDLDHTFLKTDHTLSDFSVEIWNNKSKHNIVSVATARSFQKSTEFLKKLTLNSPMILLDGAMVVTPEKKLIDIKTIDEALANAIIEEGKKFDIHPFIIALNDIKTLSESFIFSTTLNTYQKDVLKNYKNDPRMIKSKNIRAKKLNFKLVYFGKFEILSLLNTHLQKTFENNLEYKLSPEKYSNGWFLTILHKDSDKSTALLKVLEYLNQDEKNLTVFGDSINDIGMFKLAPTSIAVSNALEEVKKEASIVLKRSNDEDAVAHYLKKC